MALPGNEVGEYLAPLQLLGGALVLRRVFALRFAAAARGEPEVGAV